MPFDATRHRVDRRRLLAGFGAMCVAAATPRVLGPPGRAAAAPALANPVRLTSAPFVASDDLACFDPVTFDTMAAVAAFVVPGGDAFSHTQGVATAEAGGVEAGAPQFLGLALNQVLLDPTMVSLLLDRLGLDLTNVPLPGGTNACAALGSAVEQDGTVPLAPVVTALINLLATQVRPTSTTGPHQAPFARLSWADKGETWRRFEDLDTLLRPPEVQLDVPVVSDAVSLLDSVAGIIDYASGAVLELSGFFTYAELLAFDREARALTHRPLGWELSNYLPGLLWPPDGWDELQGYYQGRTKADA